TRTLTGHRRLARKTLFETEPHTTKDCNISYGPETSYKSAHRIRTLTVNQTNFSYRGSILRTHPQRGHGPGPKCSQIPHSRTHSLARMPGSAQSPHQTPRSPWSPWSSCSRVGLHRRHGGTPWNQAPASCK